MDLKEESDDNRKVRVIYACKIRGFIETKRVLVTEGPELLAREMQQLQQSLQSSGDLYGPDDLGTYNLSKIGKPPGIYKDREAEEILRKIGRRI